jgi:hypothetical protein
MKRFLAWIIAAMILHTALSGFFSIEMPAGAGSAGDWPNPGKEIFSGIFDESFESTGWKEIFGAPWYHCAGGCETIAGGFKGNYSLRVGFPAGSVGPGEGGAQFPVVFDNIQGVDQPLYEELHLSYYLKFEEGFDFRLGGKLPGLMGGGNSWVRSGGNQPDGTNGWTLRFMWRRDGRLVIYAYVPPSANGKWGSERWGQDIDCDFTAVPGKWHRIDQYVNVGTPGKDDGKLIIWIDGVKKLSIDDMRFWDIENEFGRIGGIYFSTFHGGNSPGWGPLHDSYMQFADFSAYKPAID